MTAQTANPDSRPGPETPAQFLRELFEFENCAECGKGERSHDVVMLPTGTPFARCRVRPETPAQRRRAQRLMPGGVPRYVRVYDNGDETCDRYTAVFGGRYAGRPVGHWEYLGLSGAPFHPQGFCQHGEGKSGPTRTPEADEHGSTRHLGVRVDWATLPEDVRAAILYDYLSVWRIGPYELPTGRRAVLDYAAGLAGGN